ncbi:MAG: L-type lectin-domain containing protein [Acidobacteriota bacterium]
MFLASVAVAGVCAGAELQLVGTAELLKDRLRLTASLPQEVGAAWYTEKQFVRGGFEATFEFQMTEPRGLGPGADGFAFVLQNSGPNAIGNLGSAGGFGLGEQNKYPGNKGIPRSLAVFFDAYRNGEAHDPSDNYIMICTAGTVNKMRWPPPRLGMAKKLPFYMKDGRLHAARVSYKPPLLRVYLENATTPVLSTPVDLSAVTDEQGHAYVGFTASTGGGFQNHDIRNWVFIAGSSSVVTSVDSSIQFLDKVTCMEGRNLCTPKEGMVEARDGGGFHVILPGHVSWAASIPNPAAAAVTVNNLHGYVCRDTCDGAVIMKNEGGRTWFSVDKIFRDNQGFFEFDAILTKP